MLDGLALGPLGALNEQPTIGDFRIPRRPLFAVVTAHFDAFDPALHLDVTSRGAIDRAIA